MVLKSMYSIEVYLGLEVYFKTTMDLSAFSFHHLILRQFRYVVCSWDKKKKSASLRQVRAHGSPLEKIGMLPSG